MRSRPAISQAVCIDALRFESAKHILLDMTSHGDSDIYDRSHPAGRQGTPQDIAGPALLLAGRGGAHLSGIILTTDGGATNSRLEALPKEIAELWLPPGWNLGTGKAKL